MNDILMPNRSRGSIRPTLRADVIKRPPQVCQAVNLASGCQKDAESDKQPSMSLEDMALAIEKSTTAWLNHPIFCDHSPEPSNNKKTSVDKTKLLHKKLFSKQIIFAILTLMILFAIAYISYSVWFK